MKTIFLAIIAAAAIRSCTHLYAIRQKLAPESFTAEVEQAAEHEATHSAKP